MRRCKGDMKAIHLKHILIRQRKIEGRKERRKEGRNDPFLTVPVM